MPGKPGSDHPNYNEVGGIHRFRRRDCVPAPGAK